MDFQKQDFERLVLLYGTELDSHQNRNKPKEIFKKWTNSMINIQGDADRHLELCYDGDKLIGFLYGKIDHPNHKGFIKVGYGYIMEFYVLPEFRRKGYGKIGIKTLSLFPNIHLRLSVIRSLYYQMNILNINGLHTTRQKSC